MIYVLTNINKCFSFLKSMFFTSSFILLSSSECEAVVFNFAILGEEMPSWRSFLASFAILLFLSRCEMLVSEPWGKERSWHLCVGREGDNQQLSSGAIQHSRNNGELKTKIRSCYKLTWLWLCPHSYIGKSLTRVMVESKTSRDLCFYPEVANLRIERKRKKKK